jgi:hypothetical protein
MWRLLALLLERVGQYDQLPSAEESQQPKRVPSDINTDLPYGDGSFCRANWLTLQVTVVHARAVGATGRSPLHRTDAGKKVLGFVNQF